MTTLTERIRADRIGVTAAKRRNRPPAVIAGSDRRDGDWWDLTLSRPGKRDLKLPFYMGPGHNGRIPDAYDVLACTTADAASLDNSRDYADWAREYGTDAGDSVSLYRAVCEQTRKLREFLGDEYDAYLWETADA
jgi:hypothetical protein